QVRACATALLERELYGAACSDAHRPSDVDELERAFHWIEARYGADELTYLFREGPLQLLGRRAPASLRAWSLRAARWGRADELRAELPWRGSTSAAPLSDCTRKPVGSRGPGHHRVHEAPTNLALCGSLPPNPPGMLDATSLRRLTAALALLATVALTEAPAFAKVTTESPYSKTLTYNGALRFIRVDQ